MGWLLAGALRGWARALWALAAAVDPLDGLPLERVGDTVRRKDR